MFDRIIDLSVKNPVFVNLLFVLVCAAGILGALNLPREQFPEVSLDRVIVSVPYPGSTAEDVEELVVRPIEEALEEVNDVKRIEATAAEGFATIQITFLAGTDLTDARSEVEKAVATAQDLPEDAETPQVREARLELPVVAVGLTGDWAVRETADRVSERLAKVPGVARVEVVGVTERRIVVELDENKLRSLSLQPTQIAAAIANARANVPAGTVENAGTELFVKTDQRLQSKEDIAKIPIARGSTLRIEDVAIVRDIEEAPDTRFYINGLPGVQMVVQREKSADPLDIRIAVMDLLPELEKDLEPGLALVVAEDYTAVIRDRLTTVAINGISGAALVLLVLLFMSGFRQALLALWGMPVSYLMATFLMDRTDITVNVISTFGLLIATGIIVDDAIVVIENTQRHMEMGKSRVQAAIDGSKEVLLPVTVAVCTTMFAFMPLTLVGGTMGRVMRLLPLTVIFCLLGSLVEAIFILPGHLSEYAKVDHAGGRVQRLSNRMKAFYKPILEFCVRRRYLVTALSFVAFVGTLAIAANMPVVIGAPGKPFELNVSWELPAGVDRAETTARGEEIIEFVEERLPAGAVKATKMRVGSVRDPQLQTVTTGANTGLIRFEFLVDNPMLEAYPAMVAELEDDLVRDPGVSTYKITEMQAGPPTGPAITARVRGRDPTELDAVIAEMKAWLAPRDGVTDVTDDRGIGKETYRVEVDQDRASLYGLTESDVANSVRAAIDGLVAAEVSIDEERVEIVVRSRGGQGLDADGIEDLSVTSAAGKTVRLDQVADLVRVRELGSINRRDSQREIKVFGDVVEGTTTAFEVSQDIQAYWDENVADEHPDLTLDFGGETEELTESLRDLPLAFLLAIGLIYVTLALQFKSYIQPFIILCAVPFGIMGAVLGLFFMGYDLSLFALFGVVALAGIVVNDSLVMVDFMNKRRAEGATVEEASISGALERLRPIVSTTLTTCLGLGPLALGLGGRDQILAPMAISIAAGLFISTFLVLVIVPAVYRIVVQDITNLLARMGLGRKPPHDAGSGVTS